MRRSKTRLMRPNGVDSDSQEREEDPADGPEFAGLTVAETIAENVATLDDLEWALGGGSDEDQGSTRSRPADDETSLDTSILLGAVLLAWTSTQTETTSLRTMSRRREHQCWPDEELVTQAGS